MNKHPTIPSVDRNWSHPHWKLCEVFNASAATRLTVKSMTGTSKERTFCLAADRLSYIASTPTFMSRGLAVICESLRYFLHYATSSA
jgi:hypothetical protein